MKIGLCGNISMDSIGEGLDKALPQSEIIVGKIGDFQKELSGPFGDFKSLDICIIALDWRELARPLYQYGFGDDTQEPISGFLRVCDDLKKTLENFRAVCTAKVLLFSPISDCTNSTGFITRLLNPSPAKMFEDAQSLFNKLCRSLPETYPVDLEEISNCIGKNNAFDALLHYGAQQPFSGVMTSAIVTRLISMLTQFQKYPLKCLVLDCDDTLWGGVVGESGFENILIGDTGPGAAYKDFQAEIVKIYKQGVFLALCSKNNTCDVLDVLERHPHMLIRPSMISCFRINWEQKPENIIEISKELKIGLDAMMFIDDNPSERELVRSTLPEIEVLELPENPAYFADTLKTCSRFWPIQLTSDDTIKKTFFAQNRQRNAYRELSAHIEEYLTKSEIKVIIAQADHRTLPRITQLFNKTNQFNLTTIRYSQNELEKFTRDNANGLFYMKMEDSFGDYGIIASALIIENVIDSFLMSCRAFGKHAETAFLRYLLGFVKSSGHQFVVARYVPTLKNSMVKDFYKNEGFVLETSSGSESVWRFDLTAPVKEAPRWIAVNGKETM